MTGVFDLSIDTLRRRRSYKWQAHPAHVLPAFVAEMDCALAPAIVAALEDAARLGDTGYAWPSSELNEALAGFLAARYGWQIAPDDVALVPDVMMGVLELLRAVCDPGDGVVITPPVYPPFYTHIAEAGCRVVEAPLARGASGYDIDFDALERAFGDARVFLLCNPHNPTGRVFTHAELERVAELAERRNVIVFSDEIHAPLTLPGARHIPFLALDERARSRSITFVSASKAWNVPGLKCAQVIAVAPEMQAIVRRLGEDFTFRVGHIGVLASIAAYRDGGAWLDEMVTALDANRTLFLRLLRDLIPGATCAAPEAGYLGWVDCTSLDVGTDPAQWFLDRGRVAVRAGRDFGTGGEGFVRVTFGTSASLLEQILQRMADAVNQPSRAGDRSA